MIFFTFSVIVLFSLVFCFYFSNLYWFHPRYHHVHSYVRAFCGLSSLLSGQLPSPTEVKPNDFTQKGDMLAIC